MCKSTTVLMIDDAKCSTILYEYESDDLFFRRSLRTIILWRTVCSELHSRHIVEFLVEMECVFVVIVESLALLSKKTHTALISWDAAGPMITYVCIPDIKQRRTWSSLTCIMQRTNNNKDGNTNRGLYNILHADCSTNWNRMVWKYS